MIIINNMIQKTNIKVKITGKTKEPKTFLGLRTGSKYLITLKIVDEKFDYSPSSTREVPFDQYSQININNIIDIDMYTKDNQTFFFSKEEVN